MLCQFKFAFFVVTSAVVIQIFTFSLTSRPTPIVTLNDGKIQGNIAYSRRGREYWQFLSIPYAEPPIDHLKFQSPISVRPWKGVKQATKLPPLCLQIESLMRHRVLGEENCLFLNVFTPPFKDGDKKRPVLVHIHGGAFIFGSSIPYQPGYFMDEELVVVTFNYRLGPLGFLNFEHDPRTDNVQLPGGNMGIKDQLLVLKWVKRNIAEFGGDPNQVTLMGESGGGGSVNLHVLSQKSQGLFHRAISHSASAFSSWVFDTKPREMAMNLVEYLKCPIENTSALLTCLQNTDPREMVKTQLCPSDVTLPKCQFTPSLEKFDVEDAFLLEKPSDIYKKEKYSNIPYIFGYNSADGSIRTGRLEAFPQAIQNLKANWTEILGNMLQLNQLTSSAATAARDYYFGKGKNLSEIDTRKFLDIMTTMSTDVLALEPIQRAAKAHAENGAPTYLFYYDYIPKIMPSTYSAFRAPTSVNDWLPCEVKISWQIIIDWVNKHIFGNKYSHISGAAHGDDILQLWNPASVFTYLSLWDLQFSEALVKTIAQFAHGTKDLKFKETPWPSITSFVKDTASKKQVPYMVMDNSETGKVVPEPFTSRLEFWNSVGIQNMS